MPTDLAIAPGTAAGAALGSSPYTADFVLTNCSGAANDSVTFTIPSGPTMTAVSGVTGVNFQVVGNPTSSANGSCPAVTITPNGTNYQFKLQGTTAYSGCTVTFKLKGRFYLGASRIVGTQSIPSTGFDVGYAGAWVSSNGFSPAAVTLSGWHAIPVYVQACAGVVNGTQTVQLPTVSTSTFARSSALWILPIRFQLALASCTSTPTNGEAGNSGYQAHINWAFTSYGGNAALIANTGTSSVGAVAILKSDVVSSVRNDTDDVYSLTNGTNTLTYYAAYYKTNAVVTAGTVSGAATFTVSYQ